MPKPRTKRSALSSAGPPELCAGALAKLSGYPEAPTPEFRFSQRAKRVDVARTLCGVLPRTEFRFTFGPELSAPRLV